MEGFVVVIYFIMFIWGILNIILFFKIWGMTNDIKDIKNLLMGNPSISIPTLSNNNAKDTSYKDSETIKVGDRVQHCTYYRDRIMFVGRINSDNTCLCVDEKGEAIATFSINNLSKI